MQIISGSSNPKLARNIAKEMGAELLETKIDNFSDGELRVQVHGNIGKNVVIVQSTCPPVNTHLMELLMLLDTAKRAGAKKITAIVPYFGYSRQDRCTYKNGPISSALVIKMLEAAGMTKLVTLDLHSDQLEGMFTVPVINLSTTSLFLPVIENQKDLAIVSPDAGGINRARNYSDILGVELAIIDKTRDADNVAVMGNIMGKVKGKNCIIIDDIVDGASTVCMAADFVMQNGAKTVLAAITHPVLSNNALNKITSSPLEKIYVSDSIYYEKLPKNFTILPTCELIAKAGFKNF